VGKVLTGKAQPNQFPSGVPHGSDAYWRLNRAHMNCVESLPVFASLVLVATVAGLRLPVLDTAARIVLAARVGQSLAHLSSGSNLAVNVRFAFFIVQVGCYVQFLLTIWRHG
jgi:uncharacterized MAPEG superfamily protein